MKKWIKTLGIKVVKTMAQTGAAMITGAGLGLTDVNWLSILSIMAMSGVYTILTNLSDLKVAE